MADENEVEVPDDLVVDIVDDTPESDRNRKALPEKVAAKLQEDDDDGLDGDVEDVRRKAKEKLSIAKKAWHDERRAKEEAQRLADEATQIAKTFRDRSVNQQQQLATGEQYLIVQMQDKVKKEVAMAKAAYKAAYESGDSEALTEAQEALNRATNNAMQVEQWKPTQQQSALQEEIPVVQRQPQAAPAAQPTFDEKAATWASKNTWYGTDEEMTKAALRVHQGLISNGVNPQSDDYYATINSTMRERFPEAFPKVAKTNGDERPATVVASVQRSAGGGRKITLTQTQVSLAKRLGLTNEQYARELIKTREHTNG